MSLLLDRAPSRPHGRSAGNVARRDGAPDRLRRFVGGRSDDTVVFARSATEAAALLVRAAPGEVVALDDDRLCAGSRVVGSTRSIDGTVARLEAELAAAPAALVIVTAVAAATGEVLPLARLAAAAHRHGARILVDAEGLAAHRVLALASWGVDYVIVACRDLGAPFDVHALVGRRDWRLSTGELEAPTAPGVIAFATAADALAAAAFDELGHRDYLLQQRLDGGLARLVGVHSLRLFDDLLDRAGAAALVVDGLVAGEVVERLSVRHGVGICRAVPHPLGDRAGAVHVSTGLGTSADDIDRLVGALAAMVG